MGTQIPSRLVYLGTPYMAVPPLRALVAAGFEIALVVTRPDAKRGRGGATTPSAVKAAAVELGLPVSHSVDDVLQVGADLGVVVAYGRIIKPHVLAELVMVNLHFSLLPRWRGAAPVERALLAGDEQTGVVVMEVAEELDAGAVYATRELAISATATADSLRHDLVELGSDLLVETLTNGMGEPVDQQGEVSYAAKIDPAELEIYWSRSTAEIDRLIRLGGAWTPFRGKRLKVWSALPVEDRPSDDALPDIRVATADGSLDLVEVQPEGKGRMAAAAWANGAQPRPEDFTSNA